VVDAALTWWMQGPAGRASVRRTTGGSHRRCPQTGTYLLIAPAQVGTQRDLVTVPAGPVVRDVCWTRSAGVPGNPDGGPLLSMGGCFQGNLRLESNPKYGRLTSEAKSAIQQVAWIVWLIKEIDPLVQGHDRFVFLVRA